MLAPQPFFEPRGTPFSVLGRLRALSYLGHEVDLVTYHIGEDLKVPRVNHLRTPAVPFVRDVPIGPSWKKLGLDFLLLLRALPLLVRNRYDLIHCHEEAAFFGVFLSRIFGVPHLYDMHSSLPQQLTNFGHASVPGVIWLFKWLEKRAIQSSSSVITVCPALEDHVKRIDGNKPQLMIENLAGEEASIHASEEELIKFRNGQDLPHAARTVIYTGTFEPYQGLEMLIEAASLVLQERSDVYFLLVGGTPAQISRLQQKAIQHGVLNHFRFPGSFSPQEVGIVLAAADILISPRSAGTNTPSKIYSYLRSGKPIVATNLETHTQVLNPNIALLVDPTPVKIAEGVLQLIGDEDLASRLALKAREFYERYYSFEGFVERTRMAVERAIN